jgi:hypothetical protein
MRRLSIAVIVFGAFAHIMAAQPQGKAQTPRQALMEMFFSKTPGTFVEHLPNATRAALHKSGALAMLQQYSAMATHVQTQGQNIQTFETGPVMLAGEDPKTGQKFEITVEKETPRSELDDIEVGFQVYKDGQPQRTPFLPKMTFSMKKEAETWKLNEISITLRLPLADPDLLKAFTEKMQAQPQVSLVAQHETPAREMPAPVSNNGPMVISAMKMILAAETTYAQRYPNTGYACTLSNLDGFGGGEPNEHQAMLLSSSLASGRKYGYVFTISNCGGTPASAFQLTAVPNGSGFGGKAFCADQLGVIRSADGTAAACLASGVPVQ